MTDIVVTVPRSFTLERWIDEGQLPGEPENGLDYHFYLAGGLPDIQPSERVYVCFNGALRGYAPLVRIDRFEGGRYGLVRHGGAVAVTIPEYIQGFRGFRYRWWAYDLEVPFPNWQNPEAKHEALPTDRRARNIPTPVPADLDNAYHLTRAIEQAHIDRVEGALRCSHCGKKKLPDWPHVCDDLVKEGKLKRLESNYCTTCGEPLLSGHTCGNHDLRDYWGKAPEPPRIS